jgi:hypothetical protein
MKQPRKFSEALLRQSRLIHAEAFGNRIDVESPSGVSSVPLRVKRSFQLMADRVADGFVDKIRSEEKRRQARLELGRIAAKLAEHELETSMKLQAFLEDKNAGKPNAAEKAKHDVFVTERRVSLARGAGRLFESFANFLQSSPEGLEQKEAEKLAWRALDGLVTHIEQLRLPRFAGAVHEYYRFHRDAE